MSVRTGMFPPPSVGPAASGMPGPMPPMGAAPNPFAPMPPMPLAGMPPPPPMGGMPPPPMPQAPMPQASGAGLGSVAGSNAPRRRMFGDYLESKLGGGQARPAPQMARPPQMQQQQRMVAPGTPMMRTPPMPSMTPRPMMYGGEVDVFGYEDGGPVVQYMEDGGLSRVEQGLVEKHGWIDAGDGTIMTRGGLIYDHDAGDTFSERLVSGLSSEQIGDAEFTQRMAAPDDRISRGSTLQIQETPSGRYAVVDTSGEGIKFSDIYSKDADPEFMESYSKYFDPNNSLSTATFSYGDREGAMNLLNRYGYDYGGDYVAPVEEIIEQPVEAAIEESVVKEQPITPITSINAATAGPGSAVNAGGNFGTGSYTADPVDPSEVNPIDYSQFTGDVGNFSNTGENFALYGPKLNIPQSVSQYMTGPSGGLATSYGPEMVATSPIGAIKMPARPVSIDIFDWLSTPTYGTMYSGIDPIDTGGADLYDYDSSVQEMRMGGEASRPFIDSPVPRQTMIGDDPHMLAYINPEEAQLLKDLGGTGEPGPGGIPAYRPSDFAAERTGTGAYSHATDNDDSGPSANAMMDKLMDSGPSANDLAEIAAQAAKDAEDAGELNAQKVAAANKAAAASMLSAGIGGVGGTNYNPTANDDRITYNKYTDNETSALDDFADAQYEASFDSSDGSIIPGSVASNLINASVIGGNTNLSNLSNYGNDTISAVVDYNTGANNQNVGNTNVTTLTDSQLSTAGSDLQGATAAEILIDQQNAAAAEAQAQAQARAEAEAQARARAEAQARAEAEAQAQAEAAKKAATASWFNSLPEPTFTSTFPGSGDSDSNSVAAAINAPNSIFDLPPPSGLPAAPSDVGATDDDLATDYTQILGVNTGSDTGSTGSGTDSSTGSGDADGGNEDEDILSLLRPAGSALGRGSGFKSIEQLKAEIAAAEGTADDGGYDRLLGYQEGNFNVVPSEMTVQQILDFQLKRGKGSYAEYSKGVNLKNNQLRADGTPKISTPVGKYQVVGSTLGQLIKDGIVDPNDKFDAATQEKIGEYLINTKRNYKGVLTGKITQDEFEKGLGQEFQGIQKDKNFSLSGGSVMNASDIEAKVASGESLTPREFSFITNQVSNATGEIEPEYGIQFGAGEESDNTGINQVSDDGSQAQNAIAAQELAAKNKAIYDRGLGSDDDPRRGNLSVNAAEAKYLQNLLSTLEFNDEGKLVDKDPNFIQDIFGKLVRNFTLGLVDINDLNKNKVQEVLDAYRETGSFVYDTEGNAIDLKTVEDLEKLEKLSAGEGQNPAVIGVRNEDGETVSFGSDIANTSEGPIEVDDDIFATIATSGDDDTTTTTTTEVDTSYTTDENGNKICNQAGYVYDVATDACVPAVAEEESTDTSLNIGSGASRSFEDVLKNIQTKATTIAPISANIKPMAQGGMAGLNRTADNFLRALGG